MKLILSSFAPLAALALVAFCVLILLPLASETLLNALALLGVFLCLLFFTAPYFPKKKEALKQKHSQIDSDYCTLNGY